MSISFEGDWIRDQFYPGQASLTRIRRRVAEIQTDYQHAELVDTDAFGLVLLIDGSIQSSQADEFIYHESLVHPALCACPARGRVAILGGGEGASLREVLRHGWVKRAILIDLDPQIVAFCRDHLEVMHQGAFDDPRAEIVISDARQWLADQPPGSLVAILSDVSEPLDAGPARLLYTREFYQLARRALAPGGTLCLHAGPGKLAATGFGALFPGLAVTVGAVFEQVQPMATHLHAFSDTWTFLLARAGAAPLPASDEIDELLAARTSGALRFFDGISHRHLTSLPRYLRAQLDPARPPFTDADPPSVAHD